MRADDSAARGPAKAGSSRLVNGTSGAPSMSATSEAVKAAGNAFEDRRGRWFDEAARYFEESKTAGQLTSNLYRNLGDAYRHLRRAGDAAHAYEAARAMTEQEVIRNPRSAAFRVRLGLISAFLGEAQRAGFEVSQALAMDADNSAVLREAALAYETLHQRERTLELLRNAPAQLLQELNHQPDVKDLQQDFRFQRLLQK